MLPWQELLSKFHVHLYSYVCAATWTLPWQELEEFSVHLYSYVCAGAWMLAWQELLDELSVQLYSYVRAGAWMLPWQELAITCWLWVTSRISMATNVGRKSSVIAKVDMQCFPPASPTIKTVMSWVQVSCSFFVRCVKLLLLFQLKKTFTVCVFW